MPFKAILRPKFGLSFKIDIRIPTKKKKPKISHKFNELESPGKLFYFFAPGLIAG
jgi:hypothetical protein